MPEFSTGIDDVYCQRKNLVRLEMYPRAGHSEARGWLPRRGLVLEFMYCEEDTHVPNVC
jgi:hypothetical protein